MTVINLESGMPTVEAAHIRLDQALRTAKVRREKVLKLIHGYGSTGKGGAIKRNVHNELSRRQHSGVIQVFVPGEDFSPFHPGARAMLNICPELSKDRDYSRGNHGITMVLL